MKPIIEAMNWRYATQKFNKENKPTKEEIMELIEAARLSPSSYGLQPWKFILVENEDLRKQLREAGYNQEKISEAPYLIVFAAKNNYTESDLSHYIESTAKATGKNVEDLKGLREMIEGFLSMNKDSFRSWSINQTHIAFGVFLAAAAISKIDAGPMGGFDPNKYDEILGLKEIGYHSAVICALGYRSNEDETSMRNKSRFEMSEVLIER